MNLKNYFKNLFLTKEEKQILEKEKKENWDSREKAGIPMNESYGGEFLFDFVGDMYGGRLIQNEIAFNPNEIDGVEGSENVKEGQEKKVQKIKAMPIDVFDQLERIPTPFSLLG